MVLFYIYSDRPNNGPVLHVLWSQFENEENCVKTIVETVWNLAHSDDLALAINIKNKSLLFRIFGDK